MQIEVENLSYIYSEGTAFEKRALAGVNFKIDKGEFVGLIGQTGSGKSTLIQQLNALLTPSTGTVLLDGRNIHADKANLKSVRQRVGLVFQYPEHQLFEATVFKDVAFGPENMGISPDETDGRVRDALRIVGIDEEYFEKSPFELSGGQKRRAAIAGVLAMRPEILILDEPTAGLDPRGREEIFENINDMRVELGITIILVSHSMEDIARLVSRVMVMSDGRIIMDGGVKEIFMNIAVLERTGLAAPQTAYLMEELKKRGFDLPDGVYTVDAAFGAITDYFNKLEAGGATAGHVNKHTGGAITDHFYGRAAGGER